MASEGQQSYIDYSAITSDRFSASNYANQLILQTHNANEPLDLPTPLSRVLFDVQEVDTHIDQLTTQNALPIIESTSARADASRRILDEVESQVNRLNESFQRLQREVLRRYESAELVRLAAERLLLTSRVGRGVQRAVQLGRQLEAEMDSATRGVQSAMVGAAITVLSMRHLFTLAGKAEEAEGLARVQVVGSLRNEVVAPLERTLIAKAQQVVREFSMSSLLASGNAHTGQPQNQQTFAQVEDTKSRTTSALHTLYLLSPTKPATSLASFEPILLISALQSYLQTALTSSLASLARALATLPQLDRTLLEISARCQNIVALEVLLEAVKAPVHPLLSPEGQQTGTSASSNFLTPLLRHLDTSSLPSYFWRSMAGQLTSRVQDILTRGGVSARTLRTNRDRVRDAIRECVDRGSQLPVSSAALGTKEGKVGSWEREAAVMVQSVIGPLHR
ncbi:hypothetical protein BAUCODRAFT_119608 [Baudoinia panamericana UAMH 10762]|uniref:Conserved oligomeric Golgi complex subunit 5 n=1 Tax=Baudoinia panamericana (strain UAMH 10762) TaxID=717646 RepID=M2N7I7_BAUPA|nr:uncharacterized protein BAUCODRAFT_119608 [Baudoinia panamericana UAMH 10762]EMD00049.1 hypothetical protein BAUCODRAFT_119608 [Baudoinia panamericana UAMH 10762]